jgi:hypothetical protein
MAWIALTTGNYHGVIIAARTGYGSRPASQRGYPAIRTGGMGVGADRDRRPTEVALSVAAANGSNRIVLSGP